MTQLQSYQSTVRDFAELGSRIINTSPQDRYETIGKHAQRALEPGYIPPRHPPLLTCISYYPNETELPTGEFATAREAFNNWASCGSVDSYVNAYNAWGALRSQIPFYRKWEAPLFNSLGIEDEDTAWLPLIKCPLPAGTTIDQNGLDIHRDRDWLWEQLTMLQPAVVLVQGAVVYEALRRSLPNLKCIQKFELQKIPRMGGGKPEQVQKLTEILKPYIDAERKVRLALG